jgi:hypothetical protein
MGFYDLFYTQQSQQITLCYGNFREDSVKVCDTLQAVSASPDIRHPSECLLGTSCSLLSALNLKKINLSVVRFQINIANIFIRL